MKERERCFYVAIETGQYARPQLPPGERVYHVCNVMEDKKHLLLNCTAIGSLPDRNSFL